MDVGVADSALLLLATPAPAAVVAGVVAGLTDGVAEMPEAVAPAPTDGIEGMDPVDARLPARSHGFRGAADAVACIEHRSSA